jgi:hypothetical protein
MQHIKNHQSNAGKQVNWQPDHLEDHLVRLVPLEPGHFEQLYKVASDPMMWEQHPAKDRYKKEVFQQFFNDAIDSGTAFLIIDKATQTVIGSTRFYDYKPEESSIAIGYTFLSRSFWGGTWNRSIKTLMLDYAFQFVDQVFFHIGINNKRSQIATTRIGARLVREMDLSSDGRAIPHYEYVIRRE